MIYKVDLTSREAQVIYIALSSLHWVGADGEADRSIRQALEKKSMKKLGLSLHDHLTDIGAIDGSKKPDIRTLAEELADTKRSKACLS
tara:strand:- start:1151 stop:1414 length:264 start_codon:yes stop_codon:yes gene_type:complete